MGKKNKTKKEAVEYESVNNEGENNNEKFGKKKKNKEIKDKYINPDELIDGVAQAIEEFTNEQDKEISFNKRETDIEEEIINEQFPKKKKKKSKYQKIDKSEENNLDITETVAEDPNINHAKHSKKRVKESECNDICIEQLHKKKKVKLVEASLNITENITEETKMKKKKKKLLSPETESYPDRQVCDAPSDLLDDNEIPTQSCEQESQLESLPERILFKEKKTKDSDHNFAFNFQVDNSNQDHEIPTSSMHQSNKMHNKKSFESLLKPTYLQNNKFKNDSFNFNEAKLLKKEEQRSRYPEILEKIVNLSEGRYYTLSIAVPASILEETCLLNELRTYVIGQLARAACIYSVDEIIVYNDQCWRSSKKEHQYIEEYMEMMRTILEYQECPPYLRKDLFPRSNYLSKVGVLNAFNAPHHLLSTEWCVYREGIVLDINQGKMSHVDVGFRNYVQIDRKLRPGLRVTVKFPPEVEHLKKSLYGTVVSPNEPRTEGGLYWGYTVRVANSLPEIFKSDQFKKGYDLIIGTSDKGDNIFNTEIQPFNHALIVFGGVDGLEIALDADTTIADKNPRNMFPYYLNCCPNQQSRTIRTEEAVLITLSTLSQKLKQCGSTTPS